MGYDIPSGNLLRFAIENIEIVDLPLTDFFPERTVSLSEGILNMNK